MPLILSLFVIERIDFFIRGIFETFVPLYQAFLITEDLGDNTTGKRKREREREQHHQNGFPFCFVGVLPPVFPARQAYVHSGVARGVSFFVRRPTASNPESAYFLTDVKA